MHAGQDEGAFAWLTLNYLLGRLNKGPENTVAAIDLGGGSVQVGVWLASCLLCVCVRCMLVRGGDCTDALTCIVSHRMVQEVAHKLVAGSTFKFCKAC
jgi:hypothetical protein